MAEAPFQLSSISFGFAAAEDEKAEDPGLLLEGFVDPFNAIPSILDGKEFVVLGPKGSGKSTVAQHLELASEDNPLRFIKNLSLEEMSFVSVRKVIRDDQEPEVRDQVAWSWLIYLAIADSFIGDQGCSSVHRDQWSGMQRVLKENSLAPLGDVSDLVSRASKKQFGIKFATDALPVELSLGTEGEGSRLSTIGIAALAAALKRVVGDLRSQSQHVIIIDGLDDVLTKRADQMEVIAAMINQVVAVNRHLREHQVPAKVVVVCRTELFERLPDANTNKFRRDYGIHFNWFHNPRDARASKLLVIAAKRAERSLGRPVDIFREFLPSEFEGCDAPELMIVFG